MAHTKTRPSWVVSACAGLVGLNLLGGCQLVGRGPERASAPTNTTTVSVANYARQLTIDAERIRSGIALISGARTYDELQTQIWAGAAVISDVSARWRGFATPSGTKAAHDRYIGLLSDLHRQIILAGGAVSLQKICAAPSVLDNLNQSGVPAKLDAAGQELAAVTSGQFQPGELVPVGDSQASRPLATGTLIRGRLTGPLRNYVTIDNKGSSDVTLTLARGKRGKTPVLSIFVKRKAKATLRGVPNGTYQSYVAEGRGWDRKLRVFTRDCAFFRYRSSEAWGVAPDYHTGWEYSFGTKSAGKSGTESVPPDEAIQA
jgi:hypothetical protein